MHDTELVEAVGPALQAAAVAAREGDVVQPGAMLVEGVIRGLRVRVQAEQLPSLEREHSVVKAPDLFVLIENGPVENSSVYQRVLRTRSVTVTATWAIPGNSGTAAS